MKINEWCKEVHEVAVAHGWWETEVDPYTAAALMHSELSEALEEYRNGNALIYTPCMTWGDGRECTKDKCEDWDNGICNLTCLMPKPEGIAIELADCAIRIMDYLGAQDFDVETFDDDPDDAFDSEIEDVAENNVYGLQGMKFCELICEIHRTISLYSRDCMFCDFEPLVDALSITLGFMRSLLSPETRVEDVIAMKHEYNKTRPYRHGGKVC